jgi:hypothetical protein
MVNLMRPHRHGNLPPLGLLGRPTARRLVPEADSIGRAAPVEASGTWGAYSEEGLTTSDQALAACETSSAPSLVTKGPRTAS